MWSLCVVVDRLMKLVGEDEDGDQDEAAVGGGHECLFSGDAYDHVALRSHFVDVPHVRQLFNWDCGLACVTMVLRTLGVDDCIGIHDLEQVCRTRSIWTVDLAYLLHKFSVKFSFFTVTVGANPKFSAETFYREQLQDDLDRVDRLFEKALETGIKIQVCVHLFCCDHVLSLSGQDISVLILSGQYIAIALVDKIKLSQSSLEDICVSRGYEGSSDYMGHYVVVCGYDVDTNEFEIRDPASLRKYERVSLELFDEARKSFGTDEDILVVSLNGKAGNKLAPKLVT